MGRSSAPAGSTLHSGEERRPLLLTQVGGRSGRASGIMGRSQSATVRSPHSIAPHESHHQSKEPQSGRFTHDEPFRGQGGRQDQEVRSTCGIWKERRPGHFVRTFHPPFSGKAGPLLASAQGSLSLSTAKEGQLQVRAAIGTWVSEKEKRRRAELGSPTCPSPRENSE